MEMIKLNTMQQFAEIPKPEYERCWNKCIEADRRGNFEGD
jgi:hypothetical protein